MFNTLFALTALFLSAQVTEPASQPADDHALRLTAAHQLMDGEMEAFARGKFAETWGVFESQDFSPGEIAALRTAYEIEADGIIRALQDVAAESVAKHVSAQDIRADADFTSPAWEAAGAEVSQTIEAWGEETGERMAIRVLEKGCAATSTPSEACTDSLARTADYAQNE